MAFVATQKYADALQLYRQSEMFKRIGIELNRTNLANWMVKSGELILKRQSEHTCGKEAITLIDHLLPDLVFMDIKLTDMKGLEVVNSLEHKPAIIFTTAYKDYSLNAFKINAVDYLLKPYSTERLKSSLERLTEKISLQPINSPKKANLVSRP